MTEEGTNEKIKVTNFQNNEENGLETNEEESEEKDSLRESVKFQETQIQEIESKTNPDESDRKLPIHAKEIKIQLESPPSEDSSPHEKISKSNEQNIPNLNSSPSLLVGKKSSLASLSSQSSPSLVAKPKKSALKKGGSPSTSSQKSARVVLTQDTEEEEEEEEESQSKNMKIMQRQATRYFRPEEVAEAIAEYNREVAEREKRIEEKKKNKDDPEGETKEETHPQRSMSSPLISNGVGPPRRNAPPGKKNAIAPKKQLQQQQQQQQQQPHQQQQQPQQQPSDTSEGDPPQKGEKELTLAEKKKLHRLSLRQSVSGRPGQSLGRMSLRFKRMSRREGDDIDDLFSSNPKLSSSGNVRPSSTFFGSFAGKGDPYAVWNLLEVENEGPSPAKHTSSTSSINSKIQSEQNVSISVPDDQNKNSTTTTSSSMNSGSSSSSGSVNKKEGKKPEERSEKSKHLRRWNTTSQVKSHLEEKSQDSCSIQ